MAAVGAAGERRGRSPAPILPSVATVSVVVPAYNASAFLDAALASVAAQSRPADEVVVVDDASSDGTGAVAERWADVLPLVLVRKPENEGLGAARRDGIARSSGDLLALLDADDYWLPDHLEVMVACYERHGGIISASGYHWVPEERLGSVAWNELAPVPSHDRQRHQILRWNFLLSNVLISREDYQAAGGFRDLRSDEDWDLWIRMIRDGARVTVPDTVTTFFRKRTGSLSSSEQLLAFDVRVLEELLETAAPEERPVVEGALRRRRARMRLLQGYDLARCGAIGPARREWLRAALQDRSFRGGLSTVDGSVALRALLCAIAPRRVVDHRDRRAADPDKLARRVAKARRH